MSYAPTTMSTAAPVSFSPLQRAWRAVMRHITYTQTVRALSQLSDRQLQDIGIHRGEIRALAQDAADRM